MKTEVSLILSLALLVTLGSTTPVATAAVTANENRDHPLISSYEGSQIRSKDVKSFDEYNAFIGMDDTGTTCLLYTSPSPRDQRGSRMPSSA